MTQIKKGSKLRHLNFDVEIIQRQDSLVLAKIQPDFSQAYYDISTVQLDSYGDENFFPSYTANGLAETLQGSQKTIKTLEVMQLAFDELVAKNKKQSIAEAEAKERMRIREEATVARKRKSSQAQEHYKGIEIQIRKLVAESPTAADFIRSKKAQKLALELHMATLFKFNI